MSPTARFLCTPLAIATLLFAPQSADAAGAVLPPSGSSDPSVLDLEMAVAQTPFGSTRWARLTVGGTPSAMWLVPARPGASLDWAADTWLGALDDATAPRVAPPSDVAPCGQSTSPERVAPLVTNVAKRVPRAVVVHTTEADLRAHVASRSFEISAQTSTKITDIYAAGYALVSLEIESGGAGGSFSSPTLRVSDDAPALLPLALTGTRATHVRVTASILANGGATLSGAREIDPATLVWDRLGSGYAYKRAEILAAGGGAIWVRESSTPATIFTGTPVPRAREIPSLVSAYLPNATCEGAAKSAAASNGTVGRICPAGDLARVPGGIACAPAPGAIDPAAFTCGEGVDDLAFALSGTSPKEMHVTRLSGIVAQGQLGFDWTIASPAPVVSPVSFAGTFETCVPPPPPTSGGISMPSGSSSTMPDDPDGRIVQESGCSGTATTVAYETGEQAVVASEGCGSTTSDSTEPTDDGCGGDTTGSGDDSGWDTDDGDASDLADSCSCGSKTSTSSSSGGSDGWDDPDMSPKKGPQKTSANKKPRGHSPVSRYALLFVALVLPLRRRLRVAKL